MSACTQEQFLKVVESHEMTVIHNDGVHRHVRFKQKGTTEGFFDLITWSGQLCISGDYGTYTFSRIRDMFEFFRGKDIKPNYWGEKLTSISTFEGYKQYSPALFEQAVKQDFDSLELTGEEKKDLRNKVKEDVLAYSNEGEFAALNAAVEFEEEGELLFPDFFEHEIQEYTFQYIWCLRAIVWGIKRFDEERCIVFNALMEQMALDAKSESSKKLLALFATHRREISDQFHNSLSVNHPYGHEHTGPEIEFVGPVFHKAFRQVDVVEGGVDMEIWDLLSNGNTCFWDSLSGVLGDI